MLQVLHHLKLLALGRLSTETLQNLMKVEANIHAVTGYWLQSTGWIKKRFESID